MRRALVLVVLALLCGAAWGQKAEAATGLTVFVLNESSVVTDAELLDALPVFQDAVTQDFARYWGVDAALYFTKAAPAGAWTITVSDESTMWGALGYHDVVGGSPVGYVFASTSKDYDVNWQEVFTHELFELLADPFINRIAMGTRLWLVEVCDPVEASANDYQRLSPTGQTVVISDFVTQAWYKAKAKGPYDFTGNVAKPQTLLPGGYVSYWTRNGWQQLFGARRRFYQVVQP